MLLDRYMLGVSRSHGFFWMCARCTVGMVGCVYFGSFWVCPWCWWRYSGFFWVMCWMYLWCWAYPGSLCMCAGLWPWWVSAKSFCVYGGIVLDIGLSRMLDVPLVLMAVYWVIQHVCWWVYSESSWVCGGCLCVGGFMLNFCGCVFRMCSWGPQVYARSWYC